jgi:dipeptidyl aminopeptidase/acylaminoacyl peptidase
MTAHRRIRVLAFVVPIGLAAAVRAQAPAPRPMTLVDLINVPVLSDPQLSPDGRQVLYVLAEADWKANERVTHIWRADVGGGDPVRLTGSGEDTSPRWSPDGATIAFLSKRAGDEARQIYLISNDGGEARRLTAHPTDVADIAWSPDGRSIYFLAADPKTEEEKAREKARDDVYAFEENSKQRHLWRADVQTGRASRVTEGDFSVLEYRLSRDGRRIAHRRGPTPLVGDSDRSEVWLMDADGGGARRLTDNRVAESGPELSPDGTRVLFVADANERFETYYNGRIFVVPAAGGAARAVTGGLPYEVESAAWGADERTIVFVANMGVHSEIFELDVASLRPRQLTDGRHAVRGWRFEPRAAAHVFGLDEPTNAGDVWVLPAGGTPRRVTRVFDYLAREFRLPTVERIEWKGADGTRVEGLLYYPIDRRPGERAPLVVQTHGGPRASDKFGFGRWNDYVQVLAAKGYAVLQPNYRGSTGYGDAFLRDMVGGYFRNAHLDVLAGVDHVIRMGVADPDRLVKMGWSAGGHMTNKIITFTDRFKAASSGAGAANWISMYAQSDTRSYRTPWFGGTPWQKDAPIDVYWEHSPLKYVANVKTPTIFLVGERDERVPAAQSIEMYRALKANGVPTRLYLAPREPHGWRELRHQLFKMNVELEWFERYARGRSYQWEQAPGETPRPAPTTAGAARGQPSQVERAVSTR